MVVRGARQHNLRDLNLDLPKNSLVVFTGVSGSGKSSLAFDTIYAEGQRRYIESLSSYARQFLKQTPKPDVDSIDGLAPSISIEQKGTGHNPRSTVGTITEIYDYLRVLYAALGTAHCPECGDRIGAQTREQILGRLLALPRGARLQLLAPVAQDRRGEYRDLFDDMRRQGFIRARVDGTYADLSTDLELDRYRRHTVEIVTDRGVVGRPGFSTGDRTRLTEAVEAALELGEGTLIAHWTSADSKGTAEDQSGELLLSSHYACGSCGTSLSPPSHASFSFNAPQGMCPTCDGLGTKIEFDPDLLVQHPEKSLLAGALPTIRSLRNRWRLCQYEGVAKRYGFSLDTPFQRLTDEQRRVLLYGSGRERIEYHYKDHKGRYEHRWARPWEGIIPGEMARYRKIKARSMREKMEALMRSASCPDCGGARLKRESLAVTVNTRSIAEVCAMSIGETHAFFEALSFEADEARIAEDALKEIRGRLGFLMDVGLHYLTLDRTAPTLAGGESQRIRLASQIGSGLVGVLYVLDEPSIGLHHRDNVRLLKTLHRLRDLGNTVLVVEHDEDTMLAADHIVDFGPGAGDHGGEAVVAGTLAQVLRSKASLTGRYLRGELEIPIPLQRRAPNGKALTIRGARQNNLKSIDVDIPLGLFNCVTGVSGSGKSSLISDILHESLARDLNHAQAEPGDHDGIDGIEHLDKVIAIDQSPIGRTPRSNPATYVGVFDVIRALYAELPDSKVRGYKPGRFSFNVKGGRCEACDGNGAVRLEMDFLADVWVKCEVCQGARFNVETQEVCFRDRSIAEVLDMDVATALEHFQNLPKIAHMLRTLHDVGMDYVKLGQPAPTLSGGEAQRIKLARELCRRSTGRTLYILDEPTTGLHFADIHRLLDVLHRFVDEGNTVVVVEHNLEVVKTADHVIDLGPEGGAEGGRLVMAGTPEALAKHRGSHTGTALKALFAEHRRTRLGEETALMRAAREAGRGKGRRHTPRKIEELHIRGAREHNLRDVSVKIPRDAFTVFSGVSGSGKSSLALDTIYAEGQRRYIESLSAYARQFLGQMKKPKVDQVAGLSPAICIEQKAASQSPRSTVGTVTEVYDYLRALYARLGVAHCPDCDAEVGTRTTSQIIDDVLAQHDGRQALLLAPVEPKGNEEYTDVLERAEREGFRRARLDGEVIELGTEVRIDRRRRHRIDLVVDRICIARRSRKRLADSVEQALQRSGGTLVVLDHESGKDRSYSQHASCAECGRTFEPLTPRGFSFNHAEGWCPACDGLGSERAADPKAAIPDSRRSLREGAVATWGPLSAGNLLTKLLSAVGRKRDVDLDTPWRELPTAQQNVILFGTEDEWFAVGGMKVQFKGVFPAFEEATKLSWHYRHRLGRVVRDLPCRACAGGRLHPVASAVRVRDRSLPQLCEMPLSQALEFLNGMKLKRPERDRAGEVLEEAQRRLRFLVEVGLDYVTIGRAAPTLSGGESQRVRLAGQIGSGLTGVLYVLDEPTIGLHPRDNGRLLGALKALRDLGNTLITVEHDRETLEAADHLVDFGPGAGPLGGKVVASGTRAQLEKRTASLTGQYLKGTLAIPVPVDRREPASPMPTSVDRAAPEAADGWLSIVGARHNNLQDIDVHLPLGSLICVTGPSGSGKSSLVHDILHKHLAHVLHRARTVAEEHDAIVGDDRVDKVISIDQAPIGNSPRSNPATYTKVFDRIRELFAQIPEARVRGYAGVRFSYNHRGGRCEACWGLGSRRIEMHFLPDVWVECDECHGARFHPETLEIRYRGASVADVLAMTVAEASELFALQPRIRRQLQMLVDVGLGYMALGQPAPTLSGGEAQRVKLARELARPGTGRTLYLLDEPTTGLHVADVGRLLKVLNRLVEAGNTVLVIEHNMEVASAADWVVDLGPGGGDQGGDLVACGPPEVVARSKTSATATYLAQTLKRAPRVPRQELVLTTQESAAENAAEAVVDDALVTTSTVQSPWEADGRQWHLQDLRLQDGKKPDWQGEALKHLMEQVGGLDGLGPAEWNRRDKVVIKPEGKRPAFFLQVRTNEYWWFRAEFRTEKGRFDQADLVKKLKIKPWNDLPERQVYGNWSRVRLQASHKRWDHITLFLWSQQEMDTPAFRRFITDCWKGYERVIETGGRG
ncbi:MAG: excinuclease ABC subunit UvrA [Gemmatimonadetes bacterium]|nr:excinuclease ABC subunit UvrA [Gemmatimonadota bacterium]